MKGNSLQTILTAAVALSVVAFCGFVGFVVFGSRLWVARSNVSAQADGSELSREVSIATLAPLPPATATSLPTATASVTPLPTETSTPVPTSTSSPTPLPTDTPAPTATPVPSTPVPVPPTPTPPPTDTPEPPPPAFAFIIKETGTFPTNHLNFDIFVAVVDQKNKPLSGYRVIGTHSNGWQVESAPTAGDWTENSGAMHYKGGNVKFSAPNSSTGLWTVQLVDEANTPVAPPVEFSFDENNPTWYFLLFERQ